MGGPDQRQRLTAAVRAALAALGERERVVLGLSGGPDSAALVHLVRWARPDLRALAVCVRHGLRDDSADVAAAVVHARAVGLACRVVAVDVAAAGRAGGGGPEAAARAARYAALVRVARSAGAGTVATGHTADDQAETVLLNLARGCGLPGLAGMPAERPLTEDVRLLRPLLSLRRADVRAVAAATGLPLAADPTNDDPAQRRSRARHRLLPLLADLTGAGSDPVAALARLAANARADAAALEALAAAEAARLVRTWGPVRCIEWAALTALPAAVASRVVARLLDAATPDGQGSGRAGGHDVERVLHLAPGQAATGSGGVLATRGGGWLAVVGGDPPALPDRDVGAGVDLPELSLCLRRDPAGTQGGPEGGRGGSGGALGAEVLPPWAPARAAPRVGVDPRAPLTVRARRPGDRLPVPGGSRPLAGAMVDAGVPRAARGLVPVVADERGPLWVPGVGVRDDAGGPAALRLVRRPTP